MGIEKKFIEKFIEITHIISFVNLVRVLRDFDQVLADIDVPPDFVRPTKYLSNVQRWTTVYAR